MNKRESIRSQAVSNIHTLVDHLRNCILAAAPSYLTEDSQTNRDNIIFKHLDKVCAIKSYRQHVTLRFYEGTRLPDPDGLLEGKGERQRFIRFRDLEDIQQDALIPMIRVAIAIDAEAA